MMTYQNLRKKYPKMILDVKQFPVPSHFCINKKNVKAIVLGCDPSTTLKNNEVVKSFTVFGIGTGDHRYFRDILNNLKEVGLNFENTYIQNVIPYHMKKETSENELWNEIAELTLPDLIKELDSFDSKRRIPVLMTSEVIYKFLLLNKNDYHKPKDLYNIEGYLPVKKERNKLGRKLFPLYRHYHYNLATDRFEKYKNQLKKELKI
jgi:hypothetical protein